MSSGKRSGFGDWDKIETRSHDVGLGLRLQHQHHNDVYSPSGEGMTRMAFTTNQRQELERQTMIYKYIMSSMPVPPELIIPLSKYPSSPNLPPLLQHTNHSSSRKGLELRYNGGGRGLGRGGGDPEPWRCRRTDGKKWRCSRDVTPDQKYCERHSHKGRPSARSRKPVESSPLVSSTSTNTTTSTTTTTTSSSNPITLNPFHYHPSSYDPTSSIPQYNHQNPSLRFPEWFMKEETVVPTAQVLYPQQIEQFSGDNRGHSNTHSHTSHFSPRSSPSGQTTPRSLPRPFIDAWSLEDVHKVANTNHTLPTEVTSRNKCPNTSSMSSILPLTLSMSAGFDHNNGQNNAKDEDNVAGRGRSWINLPSGGPLAEALCLGMSGTSNAWGNHSDELVSPHGHSTSSTGTTLSSKGSHASGDFGGQGFHLQ